MIIVGSLSFGNMAQAKSFKKIITGATWMAVTPNSDTGLWEFRRNGEMFSNFEFDVKFKIENSQLFLMRKKGPKRGTYLRFNLQKRGDLIYISWTSGKPFLSLHPCPNGFKELTLASKEENGRKKLSLAKKSLKKSSDPFIQRKVAQLLFDNNYFKDARDVFLKLGETEKIAACNIMYIATTRKIPRGVNIESAAKTFWAANAANHPSLEVFYLRAEAIAYACAITGKHKKAHEYQASLYRQAERFKILKAREMKKAGINIPRIVQTMHQYEKGNCPKKFDMSGI